MPAKGVSLCPQRLMRSHFCLIEEGIGAENIPEHLPPASTPHPLCVPVWLLPETEVLAAYVGDCPGLEVTPVRLIFAQKEGDIVTIRGVQRCRGVRSLRETG